MTGVLPMVALAFARRFEMSNGMKRGWLYAAMFVAIGFCTVALAATGRTQADACGVDGSSNAGTVRSKDQPSVNTAPTTDEAGYRRRRARRRMA
jgi:hypothetical protein